MDADVIFLQEFDEEIEHQLKEDFYISKDIVVDEKPDTLIAVSKHTFNNKPLNTEEELKKMNPDAKNFFDKLPKTSFMFFDDLVLIGVHLTSGKKNKEQIEIMLKALNELRRSDPARHFICGGDVNSYFGVNH